MILEANDNTTLPEDKLVYYGSYTTFILIRITTINITGQVITELPGPLALLYKRRPGDTTLKSCFEHNWSE